MAAATATATLTATAGSGGGDKTMAATMTVITAMRQINERASDNIMLWKSI